MCNRRVRHFVGAKTLSGYEGDGLEIVHGELEAKWKKYNYFAKIRCGAAVSGNFST
ncbi:hypothetical protein D3C73_1643350 [compost metagenome]